MIDEKKRLKSVTRIETRLLKAKEYAWKSYFDGVTVQERKKISQSIDKTLTLIDKMKKKWRK